MVYTSTLIVEHLEPDLYPFKIVIDFLGMIFHGVQHQQPLLESFVHVILRLMQEDARIFFIQGRIHALILTNQEYLGQLRYSPWVFYGILGKSIKRNHRKDECRYVSLGVHEALNLTVKLNNIRIIIQNWTLKFPKSVNFDNI